MSLAFWRNASPRRKRVLSTIVVFIVAIMITVIGSLMPMDPQQAKDISNNLNQTINTMKQDDTLLPYILGNNFMICLLMFIPVIGPLLGFYILFNTGTVIGAISAAEGIPAIVALAVTFIPIGLIEFTAYSAAMTESIWLFRRILQGRGLRELKNASLFVSICAILLLLGAIIETALISIGA
ncbi:MAG TPA: stage II sporulation protein M [Candidatus Bathyarchaeia archaeon]|nr:stage II sporulation protein M [Candidatus Bathyarchaeia archaeon]